MGRPESERARAHPRGDPRRARDGRHPLPERARSGRPREERLRGRPRDADRQAPSRGRHGGRVAGAGQLRARRPRPRLRHAHRRQAQLPEQRRLRRLRLRPQDGREASEHQGRCGDQRPLRRCTAQHQLLLGPCGHQPGRTSGDQGAARRRGSVHEHQQALPDGDHRRREARPLPHRDGGRDRRRRRCAARTPDPQLHAVRGGPPRARRPQPRSQPGRGRARARERLHAHAACRRDRPSDAGRQSRRPERRGAQRRRPPRACLSGRPGLLRRRPERDRPQDRRLHRWLARGLPPRRRFHAARPLLRRADGDGHDGHRRQGARLAGRDRRLAQHLRQCDDATPT